MTLETFRTCNRRPSERSSCREAGSVTFATTAAERHACTPAGAETVRTADTSGGAAIFTHCFFLHEQTQVATKLWWNKSHATLNKTLYKRTRRQAAQRTRLDNQDKQIDQGNQAQVSRRVEYAKYVHCGRLEGDPPETDTYPGLSQPGRAENPCLRRGNKESTECNPQHGVTKDRVTMMVQTTIVGTCLVPNLTESASNHKNADTQQETKLGEPYRAWKHLCTTSLVVRGRRTGRSTRGHQRGARCLGSGW